MPTGKKPSDDISIFVSAEASVWSSSKAFSCVTKISIKIIINKNINIYHVKNNTQNNISVMPNNIQNNNIKKKVKKMLKGISDGVFI